MAPIAIPPPGTLPWTATGTEIINEINALRYSFPTCSYITSDLSNATTVFADAIGLGFAVAASSRYFFELFCTYNADAARDMLATWSVPAGASGWWTPNGVVAAATSNGGTTGELNGQSVILTDFHAFAGGGGVNMFAGPVGTVITAGTPGAVQFRYSLFTTASGSGPCTIRAGSMIRVTQLA